LAAGQVLRADDRISAGTGRGSMSPCHHTAREDSRIAA